MLVLPSITVPAARQRSTTVASYGATKFDEHPRPAGGPDAVGAEDVLVRDRHARERPAVAARQRFVGRARIGQRPLGRHGDERVELGRQALDAAEEVQRQVQARELAGPEAGSEFGDGQGVHENVRFELGVEARLQCPGRRSRGSAAARLARLRTTGGHPAAARRTRAYSMTFGTRYRPAATLAAFCWYFSRWFDSVTTSGRSR